MYHNRSLAPSFPLVQTLGRLAYINLSYYAPSHNGCYRGREGHLVVGGGGISPPPSPICHPRPITTPCGNSSQQNLSSSSYGLAIPPIPQCPAVSYLIWSFIAVVSSVLHIIRTIAKFDNHLLSRRTTIIFPLIAAGLLAQPNLPE